MAQSAVYSTGDGRWCARAPETKSEIAAEAVFDAGGFFFLFSLGQLFSKRKKRFLLKLCKSRSIVRALALRFIVCNYGLRLQYVNDTNPLPSLLSFQLVNIILVIIEEFPGGGGIIDSLARAPFFLIDAGPGRDGVQIISGRNVIRYRVMIAY